MRIRGREPEEPQQPRSAAGESDAKLERVFRGALSARPDAMVPTAQIRALAAASGEHRAELRASDFYDAHNTLRSSVLYDDLLPLLLRYTNMRSVVSTRDLLSAIVRQENTTAVRYLLPEEAQELVFMLRASGRQYPSLLAAAVQTLHGSARSASSALAFPADPLSPQIVRMVWDYEKTEDGIRLLRYRGTDTDILLPHRVGAEAVTQISSGAFRVYPGMSVAQKVARDNIYRVEFPGTISCIPAGLFCENPEALHSAVLCSGIRSIAEEAFSGCSIRTISLPSSMDSVGSGAFSGCSALRTVELPHTLARIAPETFARCSSMRCLPDIAALSEVADRAFMSSGLTQVELPADGPAFGERVFSSCEDLTSVRMQEGVTEVPKGAFHACHALSDVAFSSTVQIIREDAFAMCRQLQQILLPDGIREIQGGAFRECWRLRDAALPDSLSRIGAGAFRSCVNLTEVVVPGGVELGEEVFSGCLRLAEAVLPEDLAEIPARGFLGCSALARCIVPEGTKVIGQEAFSGSGLTEARVPEGVERVERGAYSACAALESIRIDGAPDMEAQVFRNCKALASVAMAARESIPWETFRDCSALAHFRVPDGVHSIGTGAFRGSGLQQIAVPDCVEEIREAAFADCRDLAGVTFGEGSHLREISSRTFCGCTSLRTICLPEGVREIRDAAFAGSGVERVVLPASLRRIGPHAFSGCASLREVVFLDDDGAGVPLEIAAFSFCECSTLAEVQFPERLVSIGRSAFEKSGLVSVTIPAEARDVGPGAFRDAVDLEDAVIRAGGENAISPRMFEGCTALRQVRFEGDVTHVPARAFQHTAVEEVEIPKAAARIGNSAFRSCNALRRVRFRSNPQIGTDVFRSCHHLSEVVLPEGMRELPARTFRNCTRLAAADLPAGLIAIGERAFHGAGLVHADVPDSVRRIGEGAFYGCRKLREISLPEEVCIERGAFLRCAGLADENGTVAVHGVIYGSGHERRCASVSSKGEIRPPKPEASSEPAPPLVLLPEQTPARFDPLLVLPDVVYVQDNGTEAVPGLPADLCIGDTVAYGRFPDDTDFVRHPVFWVVTDVEGDEATLAARDALLFRPEGEPSERFRQMLDTAFLGAAFSREEQDMLVADPRTGARVAVPGDLPIAETTRYARFLAERYPGAGEGIGYFVRPAVRVRLASA